MVSTRLLSFFDWGYCTQLRGEIHVFSQNNLLEKIMSFQKNSEFFELRLDFIDGLKGLAILMVMFFHASLQLESPSYIISWEMLERLSRGVQLFFIISAFSLCVSTKKHAEFYRLPTFVFYIKRFFRILPPWWLTVILYHFYFARPHSTFDFWATFFLYFGFFPDAWTICIVPIGWSLFVEGIFYLFFPLFWHYIRNTWHALSGLIASCLISIVWVRLDLIKTYQFTHINPLANFYAFFAGILLYYLYSDHSWVFNLFLRRTRLWVLNLLGLLCLIMVFFTHRLTGTLLLACFFFISIIPSTLWGQWIRQKWLQRYGICCYSLYLFHSPIYHFLIPWQKQFFSFLGIASAYKEIQLIFWFAVLAPVCLFLCEISWQHIEQNSIWMGKKVLKSLQLRNISKEVS